MYLLQYTLVLNYFTSVQEQMENLFLSFILLAVHLISSTLFGDHGCHDSAVNCSMLHLTFLCCQVPPTLSVWTCRSNE